MAAQGYVLGMVEAARLASAGAPASTDDLNTYLGRCALDLFSIIMFGELSNVSNTTTPTYPENKVFVIKCCQLLERFQCCFLPYKMVVGKQLGLTKQKNQFTFANFEKCWGIVYAKIERFGEQKRYDSYQKM
jgi:hypothetical protein